MQVRADFTVTFAAPKAEMLLDPRAGNAGKLIVADIGIPAEFLQSDLELSEPRDFAPLFQPRKRDANKGDYGHVLVVGGAPGKTGAVAMSGLGGAADGRGTGDGRVRGFLAAGAGVDDAIARCDQPGSHDGAGDRARAWG